MADRVVLGPCKAIRHEQDPGRFVVLLPGLMYPTRAPALWFAREAVMSRGWSALEVLGEPGNQPRPLSWERECAERALAAVEHARVLVIGKSLASRLAGLVAARDLPAVWLTPLLHEPEVSDALAETTRATLLIGGTADETWQPGTVADSPAIETLEIADADHGLQVPGDPHASLAALQRTVDAITAFVAHM